MLPVLRDEHLVIEHKPSVGLFRATRSPLPYGSLAEVEELFARVRRLFLSREAGLLLVDLRYAPLLHEDGDLSVRVREHTESALSGFRRIAYLVAHPIGRMRLARLSSQSGLERPTFTDERAALRHLGITTIDALEEASFPKARRA